MTDSERLANTLLDWQAREREALRRALGLTEQRFWGLRRRPMTEGQWSRLAKTAEAIAKTARDAENAIIIDRALRSLERELAGRRKPGRRKA